MLKKREVGAKFKTYPIRELTHDWLKRKHNYEATWMKVKKQKKENEEKENSCSWGKTSW